MKKQDGFTLIELSIVLVIIGLVLGGVIVGKDLIKAAELRALASQVDQFKIAANTFKNKYNALPGDMPPSQAAKFAMFTFTGGLAGWANHGDANGLIHALYSEGCPRECGAFWRHLSDAGLITTTGSTLEGNTSLPGNLCPGVPVGEGCWNDKQSLFMPSANWNGAYWAAGNIHDAAHVSDISGMDTKRNIFFMGKATDESMGYWYNPTMSGMDTYSLDSKIDDGKPNSGHFMVTPWDPWSGEYGFYWSNGTVDRDGNPLGVESKVCTITIGGNSRSLAAVYNTNPAKGGNNISCYPVFVW